MAAGADDVLQRYLANPPVVEAVAGIEFRPRPMDVVTLVRETTKWATEYPDVTPQPPLPPTRPAGEPGPGFELQFQQGIAPTRLWAISSDRSWLVQTQEDRLLVNWRKIADDSSYPRFDAIRDRLLAVHGLLDRPQGAQLAPLVAEFTYVNHIQADVRGLHATYAIFNKPERTLPGDLTAERYEAITRFTHEHGTGQLAVTIQPGPGTEPTTTLNVTTKVFAAEALDEDEFITLVDAAHEASKQGFFAVVSDATTSRWEGAHDTEPHA